MGQTAGTGKLVFTFPGQGSFHATILGELFARPTYGPHFEMADRISRRILGHAFLPLAQAASAAERTQALTAFPDLDQIAIYVTEVLIADLLITSGVRPDLLLGHSFGEVAALAVAGAYSFETGLRIVCQRVMSLQPLTGAGQMGALSCGPGPAGKLFDSLSAKTLQIAVLNHERQTVISGDPLELAKLSAAAAAQGINLTALKSRYPFHSSLLFPAVTPFRTSLCSYKFGQPVIPVYLGTENQIYGSQLDLADVLAAQFVRKLDFAGIVKGLSDTGYRRFVECGAGDIVTGVVSKALNGVAGLVCQASAHPDTGLAKGMAAILDKFQPLTPNSEGPLSRGWGEVPALLRDVQALMERTAGTLRAMLPPFAHSAEVQSNTEVRQAQPEVPPSQVSLSSEPGNLELAASEPELQTEPIAIISMGCVLPGARNPEQYWHNLIHGVSGIVDLAKEDKSMAQDFLSGDGTGEVKIVPDKTYTLLHGSVGQIDYDPALLGGRIDEAQFQLLSRAEKLLALATAQSLQGLSKGLSSYPHHRLQFILGATGDGCGEYDESLFLQNVDERLETVEPDPVRRRSFSALVRKGWSREAAGKSPTAKYQDVAQSVLGHALRMYVVDAACSSSLYAVNLGMKALQNRSADVILAGGVFAPGPANNTLFAQFRGLTPSASRPLDAAADGVVFGDGAGILVLKRLTDAVADQDRIIGVIRGMGVSSDGKSPAINVPQKKGQGLAIKRAYERSGIDPDTIQYVEAHATGTPVGDSVEFQALSESLPRGESLPRVELGSVKSLIGHTGWAAGVASVIKLIQSFAARTIPPQHNFTAAGPEIALTDSQFNIATEPHPWPRNSGLLPMRAAINGFGFGGTNAHLLLESYDAVYHGKLCGRIAARTPAKLAVISAAALFPSRNQLTSDSPAGEPSFQRKLLTLPKGKMLLPDVQEHMDASQYLAALGAERVLSAISAQWPKMRGEIAVVMGVEAKTERGTRANQRIFLDRLKRRVAEAPAQPGLTQEVAGRIAQRLEEAIHEDVIPSGPYTLPGLMPNVVAGRVAHMFDLNGPNIVLDMGSNSLFQCIAAAADFLGHNECKIVLAGGINTARTNAEHSEGACVLALTTLETAKEFSLPVECVLTLESAPVPAGSTKHPASANYRGAHGIIEIAQALADTRAGKPGCVVRESPGGAGNVLSISFAREGAPEGRTETPAVVPVPAATPSASSTSHAYVQGTPIHYFTPVLVPSEASSVGRPTPLLTRKILFLTDQPEQWLELERSGALTGLDYRVLCPRSAGISRAIELALESEEKITGSLQRLEGSFDTILPILSLDDSTAASLLGSGTRTPAVLDLLFAVCRQSYAAIEQGKVWVASLCLNAFRGENLDPHTGLVAGFVKALARELPNSVCRIVNTTERSLQTALQQVELELACVSGGAEICYRDGKRFTISLAPLAKLAQGDKPVLNSDSVVLATGGGRGVTAVLAEELLTRFGCAVVALGRTDPNAAPEKIRAMDEAQIVQYEPQYYKERMAQGARKIVELKREYQGLQAAHEVSQTIRQLSALPGRFEYISTDLTDAQAVNAAIDAVFRTYGRIDMVMHGAGVQVSKVLPKKSLRDFQGVVSAKLYSLRLIHQACTKHAPGRPVEYQILTSAFSYMGNDGQEDYGAANETLNRLASVMNTDPRNGQWTSVAWLGWAGIGMTRGSEYAALAASRKLRGVTKEEGQKIFAELLHGRATAPINILLADGEIDFYKVKTAPGSAFLSKTAQSKQASPPAKKDSLIIERSVCSETAPYIWDHLVDGIPTLPGAFLIMLIAETALELRPGLRITAFEDAAFRRFVRLKRDGATNLRLQASVVSEDDRSTLVRVAILADFVHKNGAILQKDVEQTAISVRLGSSIVAPPRSAFNGAHGRMLEDPYLMEDSPVRLNGPFRAMKNITADDAHRSADYSLRDGVAAVRSGYQYLLPNLILMDALWRFGAIHRDAQDGFPIYVPEACKVMKIYYDFANPDEKLLTGKLTFAGSNPRLDVDRLTIGPVEAKDPSGSTLIQVDGGLCRKLGEARHGT
jgi:3-oxoacyl-(acyl-carrier-protein) synthase/NAD(P)-dependent dehydrogenase (short-subunit alcohol dehydrogenase family)